MRYLKFFIFSIVICSFALIYQIQYAPIKTRFDFKKRENRTSAIQEELVTDNNIQVAATLKEAELSRAQNIKAEICSALSFVENALIADNAAVEESVPIADNASIEDNVFSEKYDPITEHAVIEENAPTADNVSITSDTPIEDKVFIADNAAAEESVPIADNASIEDNIFSEKYDPIAEYAVIEENVPTADNVSITSDTPIEDKVFIADNAPIAEYAAAEESVPTNASIEENVFSETYDPIAEYAAVEESVPTTASIEENVFSETYDPIAEYAAVEESTPVVNTVSIAKNMPITDDIPPKKNIKQKLKNTFSHIRLKFSSLWNKQMTNESILVANNAPIEVKADTGRVYHSNTTQQKDSRAYSRLIQEVGVSLFLPTNSKTKKIYGNHWLRYQFRTMINMNCVNSRIKNAFFLFGFDYTKKKGESSGISQSSSEIIMTPFIVGLRYLFPLNRWLNLSTDFGLYWPMIHIYNRQNTVDTATTTLVQESLSRSTPGLLFQGNLSFFPNTTLFSLNVHLNYTYAELGRSYNECMDAVSENRSILSGVNIGTSFGFYF